MGSCKAAVNRSGAAGPPLAQPSGGKAPELAITFQVRNLQIFFCFLMHCLLRVKLFMLFLDETLPWQQPKEKSINRLQKNSRWSASRH